MDKRFYVIRVARSTGMFVPETYTGCYAHRIEDAKRFSSVNDVLAFLISPHTLEHYVGAPLIARDIFSIQIVTEHSVPRFELGLIL